MGQIPANDLVQQHATRHSEYSLEISLSGSWNLGHLVVSRLACYPRPSGYLLVHPPTTGHFKYIRGLSVQVSTPECYHFVPISLN